MAKGRKFKSPGFVALERKLFHTQAYKDLTCTELRLYLHIKAYYFGKNSGKIELPYTAMMGINGFSSCHTVAKAIKGLMEKGWIYRNQIGGLFRKPTTYGLTWKWDLWDPQQQYETKHNLGKKR